MTKIMCGNVMCKFNKSEVSQVAGECTNDKITLKYVNIVDDKPYDGVTPDIEVFEKANAESELLNCVDFVWQNKKLESGVEHE